jgi:hypothetical protein
MKRFLVVLVLLFAVFSTTPSSANWRWASPKLKERKVTYSCADYKCLKKTYIHERHILRARIKIYNKHRAAEWKHWIAQPIADCTWAGESSPPGDTSGQFARYRYSVRNSSGSDAYGKYQMMPGTYSTYAKYFDWSPLDQEIAAHRLYTDSSTGPWASCG